MTFRVASYVIEVCKACGARDCGHHAAIRAWMEANANDAAPHEMQIIGTRLQAEARACDARNTVMHALERALKKQEYTRVGQKLRITSRK